MSGFETYMHSPTLETMLTFQGWRGGFTATDRDAMADGLAVVRNAVVQPAGLARGARKQDRRHVSEAEFDRAVMQVLCGAMALLLSGRLAEVEVDS